ncbi:MAG: hypothetical protein Dasosvirus3_15 [Dasosvirus sp.]|uniref:Uncharacterized protein n=1 Tax=Dasosvirus sp. TaxID=2487764 RepID=A0A3G4ZRC1_9VIRU|nr:MAG: hypothetical protein Dasosvirus3_15 [Dasosvirus sp.]
MTSQVIRKYGTWCIGGLFAVSSDSFSDWPNPSKKPNDRLPKLEEANNIIGRIEKLRIDRDCPKSLETLKCTATHKLANTLDEQKVTELQLSNMLTSEDIKATFEISENGKIKLLKSNLNINQLTELETSFQSQNDAYLLINEKLNNIIFKPNKNIHFEICENITCVVSEEKKNYGLVKTIHCVNPVSLCSVVFKYNTKKGLTIEDNTNMTSDMLLKVVQFMENPLECKEQPKKFPSFIEWKEIEKKLAMMNLKKIESSDDFKITIVRNNDELMLHCTDKDFGPDHKAVFCLGDTCTTVESCNMMRSRILKLIHYFEIHANYNRYIAQKFKNSKIEVSNIKIEPNIEFIILEKIKCILTYDKIEKKWYLHCHDIKSPASEAHFIYDESMLSLDSHTCLKYTLFEIVDYFNTQSQIQNA